MEASHIQHSQTVPSAAHLLLRLKQLLILGTTERDRVHKKCNWLYNFKGDPRAEWAQKYSCVPTGASQECWYLSDKLLIAILRGIKKISVPANKSNYPAPITESGQASDH